MRQSPFFQILAVIAILITSFGPVGQTVVLADAPDAPALLPEGITIDSDCWGLDIVFLVSQSTMSNVNDTFKLRMEGVHSAIDALGENALFFCAGYTHRIAVIGFGQPQGANAAPVTETYLPIPGKDGSDLINPSLANLAAWDERKKNELKTALPIKDLGAYSHYPSAFEAAAAQLKTWRDRPVDQKPRRRAVIVIGEGGLCTAELQCGNYDQVISGLNRLLDPNGSAFPFKGENDPDSVAIYFLGILARRVAAYQFLEDATINAFWTNLTESHGGQLLILQRGQGDLERNLNTDLSLKLGRAMENLLGGRMRANNCQPVWINPYASQFTILHFFRKNAAGQDGVDKVAVSIVGSKGSTPVAEYSGGQTKQGPGKVVDYSPPASEKYVLYQTPPGQYTVSVSGGDFCQDIDLQVGQIGITAEMLNLEQNTRFSQVDAAPYYDASNPFRPRVQLLTPSLQGVLSPLKELEDYPLSLKLVVKIQSAGGQNPITATYPLNRVDDANAIYETKDPVVMRYPGAYSWSLSIDTRNPRQFDPNFPISAPLAVLRKEGVFYVGMVTQSFSFNIQNLKRSQQLQLVDGALSNPLEVVAQVVNPDQSAFRIDQTVAPRGTSPFVAVLKHPNGQLFTKELAPANKVHFYSAQLSIHDDRPNSFDPGCYSLQVKLKDDFDRSVFMPERAETEPVSICLVAAQKFGWILASPGNGEEYPLHQQLASGLVKLPMVIQAVDANNHQIKGADLLASDKPLFVGVINQPGKSKGIPIAFNADPETGNFVADWPAEADQEGQYTLRVSMDTQALKPTYFSPLLRLDPVEFQRKDSLLSRPGMAPIVGVAIGLAVLVVAIVLISGILRGGRRRRGIYKV